MMMACVPPVIMGLTNIDQVGALRTFGETDAVRVMKLTNPPKLLTVMTVKSEPSGGIVKRLGLADRLKSGATVVSTIPDQASTPWCRVPAGKPRATTDERKSKRASETAFIIDGSYSFFSLLNHVHVNLTRT